MKYLVSITLRIPSTTEQRDFISILETRSCTHFHQDSSVLSGELAKPNSTRRKNEESSGLPPQVRPARPSSYLYSTGQNTRGCNNSLPIVWRSCLPKIYGSAPSTYSTKHPIIRKIESQSRLRANPGKIPNPLKEDNSKKRWVT